MTDISLRIPTNDNRIKYLELNNTNKELLSGVSDVMYKPKGKSLEEYHPNKICVRLRQFFGQPSTLTEIVTIKSVVGYTDEKNLLGEGTTDELKRLADKLGYEPWGEMGVQSTEYTMKMGKNLISVLYQEIKPVGKYLKIECPNKDSMNHAIKALKISKQEKIERNAAVLLAEKMGLIK